MRTNTKFGNHLFVYLGLEVITWEMSADIEKNRFKLEPNIIDGNMTESFIRMLT